MRARRLDEHTSERLTAAIDAGDAATLNAFAADLRGWLTKRMGYGDQSILGYASNRGRGAIIDTLVQLGCDPNEPCRARHANTPLTYAIAGNLGSGTFPDVENVRVLLARDALVDSHPGSGVSPLQMAAISGNLAAAQLLVEAGADLCWEKHYNPPLDEAIEAQRIATGQDKVAEYLRSVGATVTYLEWHNWRDRQLECIERTLGIVNPRPIERRIGTTSISVYKSRFAPRRFDYRLLFTHGLAPHLNAELGIVVSNLWPLNKNALVERRFSWPVELLFHLAGAALAGARIEHGSVLREADEILGGFSTPVPEWIVAKSGRIEEARAAGAWVGTVPVLLLTPVLTKRRYKPGKEARAEADKRGGFKWERLHLPLPDLMPVGYEYLKQLDEPEEGSAG